MHPARGLVEDADAAADAVAVLETATDWAARGALAGGLMALAANASDGAGFVRATKDGGRGHGGERRRDTGPRTRARGPLGRVRGPRRSLREPVADVTNDLSQDPKTAAARVPQ